MPLVPVTNKTRWECQHSGKCCNDIIIDKEKNLSILKDGKPCCKHLTEDNMCNNYAQRPFICRVYPFYADPEKIVDADGVARPQKAFSPENLLIHTECPGFGKGKRIFGNKRLQRELERLGYDFAVKLKEAVAKGEDPAKFI